MRSPKKQNDLSVLQAGAAGLIRLMKGQAYVDQLAQCLTTTYSRLLSDRITFGFVATPSIARTLFGLGDYSCTGRDIPLVLGNALNIDQIFNPFSRKDDVKAEALMYSWNGEKVNLKILVDRISKKNMEIELSYQLPFLNQDALTSNGDLKYQWLVKPK